VLVGKKTHRKPPLVAGAPELPPFQVLYNICAFLKGIRVGKSKLSDMEAPDQQGEHQDLPMSTSPVPLRQD